MGGYVPTFKNWEKFQGATNPRLVCEWLNFCGYIDIQDLTFMLNKNSQPLSRFKKIPLNILFNKFHYQNTDETVPKNNIELVNILLSLQQDIHNKNKSVVLFTGKHKNFIGYPFDHYVYLNKLELISDNTLVNYEIITYGKKKYCENVTLEEFNKTYRGHIVATKPNRNKFYKKMA